MSNPRRRFARRATTMTPCLSQSERALFEKEASTHGNCEGWDSDHAIPSTGPCTIATNGGARHRPMSSTVQPSPMPASCSPLPDTIDASSRSYGDCLALWSLFREAVQKSASPNTPPDVILKRTAYLTYLWLTIPIAFLYAVMYTLLRMPVAAALAVAYCGIASLCIHVTISYGLYEYSSLLFKVLDVNPFLVQFALRGILQSGSVMAWSLLSPVGAALVHDPVSARPYFGMYLVNICIACLFELYGRVPSEYQLEPTAIFRFGLHYAAFGGAVFWAASTFASHFRQEQCHSEQLLSNIFPETIAERLKAGEAPFVDENECVTILFANLVGFMRASSSVNADFLIGKVLRDVFATFDRLVEKRGLEKIKTIGDIYMVVGGLHEQNGDHDYHAQQVVLLAMDFEDALSEVLDHHGIGFKLRMGIHTGPAISGVLGGHRFVYDVWGDSVNLASRMESTGVAGQIQISGETYEKIKSNGYGSFRFRSREEVMIKGKGMMRTFLVSRRRHSENLYSCMGDTIKSVSGGAYAHKMNLVNGDQCHSVPAEKLLVSSSSMRHLESRSVFIRNRLYDFFEIVQVVNRESIVALGAFSVTLFAVQLAFFFEWGDNRSLYVCWAYLVASLLSAAIWTVCKSYDALETSQMVGMYLVSMVGHILLSGGFRKHGNGAIWMFIFPLLSALFQTPRKAQLWFLVYWFSTICCYILDSSYREGSVSTTTVVQFAMNNLGPLTVVFTCIHLYATEIKREYSFSESLLLNALPPPVLERLKRGEKTIMDQFENTTILVADLVGFTTASSVMDPQFLIGKFLNDLFYEFDKLISPQKNMEKIKTIGDCLVVVGGLSEGGKKSGHARQILLLANEIHCKLREVNDRHGTNFQMRIGVHTGPLVAGVLGAKRFRYDVWGEAVTTACRLEQECTPGHTHISASTYNAIAQDRDLFYIKQGDGLLLGNDVTMKSFLLESNVGGRFIS